MTAGRTIRFVLLAALLGILAGGITAVAAALVCWGAFAGESAWPKHQPRS